MRINGLRYSWVSKKTANLHQSNEKVHSSFITKGKTIDEAERERALAVHCQKVVIKGKGKKEVEGVSSELPRLRLDQWNESRIPEKWVMEDDE